MRIRRLLKLKVRSQRAVRRWSLWLKVRSIRLVERSLEWTPGHGSRCRCDHCGGLQRIAEMR